MVPRDAALPPVTATDGRRAALRLGLWLGSDRTTMDSLLDRVASSTAANPATL